MTIPSTGDYACNTRYMAIVTINLMENGAICMYHDFECSAIWYARCSQWFYDTLTSLSIFMGIIVFLWSIWWLLDYCWPVHSIVSTQIGSKIVHYANANGNSTALWVFVRIHFEPDLRADNCAENFASRVRKSTNRSCWKLERWNCYPYIDAWDETCERLWNGPKINRSIECFSLD